MAPNSRGLAVLILTALAAAGFASAVTGPAAGATPTHRAAVARPPATAPLTGVGSLVTGRRGYCAVLTSGGVDCWGYWGDGELGNGTAQQSRPAGSAVPVQVDGVGGAGTLTEVIALVSSTNNGYHPGGYCALLASHQVACWVGNPGGALGSGKAHEAGSDVPELVVGVGLGGSGRLGGVVALVDDGQGRCALLDDGGVACWGDNEAGELGDGKAHYLGVSGYGSPTPVRVIAPGRSGTLTGVSGLVTDYFGQGYCAPLTSGGVDCWGRGAFGELGDGKTYTPGATYSRLPVRVVDRAGALHGVVGLVGGLYGFCAVFSDTGVDCWGSGSYGELGGGKARSSSVPVQVLGVGRAGTLTGVASLTGGVGACALTEGAGVDCWGLSADGQLGDGKFHHGGAPASLLPVQVLGPATQPTSGRTRPEPDLTTS